MNELINKVFTKKYVCINTHTHTRTLGLELGIEKVIKKQPELRVNWVQEKGWNYV